MSLTMNRREVLRQAMAVLGGASLLSSQTLFAAAASLDRDAVPEGFTAAQVAWLDEVADTILPETDTPGAKQAACGALMAIWVADVYEPEEAKTFLAGMDTLEQECQAAYGAGFMAATPDQRVELLTRLDQEAKNYQDSKAEGDADHYFRMMKELTLFGYFTSEPGRTKALRYIETPGRWDPCIDYDGGPLWVGH